MKYRMGRFKVFQRIALIALMVYMVTALNVLQRVGDLVQYSIYKCSDAMISNHYSKYILSENEGLDDRILEEINNQMYGINYIINEAQKESLVDNKGGMLIEYAKKDKEVVKEKEEEIVEVAAISPPSDSIVYTTEQLENFDFLMSNLYIVPARAQVLESDLVANEMLAKDMTIKGSNDAPQILVYHTHSQEAFADSVEGKGMTIVQVGEYLTELLTQKGFNVIHCKDSFDVDANGNLDRSNAYVNALPAITQILEDNPTIEVVLDIHRDGLPENVDKLVTNINGKPTAKIMFFNGVSRSSAVGEIDYLYNQYRGNNLALSFQAKLKAMEYYPDFTRKNYIDAYQYNQHVIDRAMLIEVGAQNNDFAEARNAMEPLADILYLIFAKKG